MFGFTYDTNNFEHTFGLPDGALYSQEAIIEVALRNSLAPRWVYSEGQPVCVGILHQNRIQIFLAEKEQEPEFNRIVFDTLNSLSKETELYSFNGRFASGVLSALFDGFEFPIKDLAPVRGKGWSREKCYQVLRQRKIVDDKEIYDKTKGDMQQSVIDWRAWLKDGEHQHLMDIGHGIIAQLYKDSLIHRAREWFTNEFKTDSGGFVK